MSKKNLFWVLSLAASTTAFYFGWRDLHPPVHISRSAIPEKLKEDQSSLPKSPSSPDSIQSQVMADSETEDSLSPPSEGQISSVSVQEEFEKATSHILASLPTTAEINQLTDEEVHDTPSQLIQAGAEIGKVLDWVAQHPELKPQAMQFFENCAKAEKLAISVRAVCFSQLSELDEGYADSSHLPIPGVPDEVREIAEAMALTPTAE